MPRPDERAAGFRSQESHRDAPPAGVAPGLRTPPTGSCMSSITHPAARAHGHMRLAGRGTKQAKASHTPPPARLPPHSLASQLAAQVLGQVIVAVQQAAGEEELAVGACGGGGGQMCSVGHHLARGGAGEHGRQEGCWAVAPPLTHRTTSPDRGGRCGGWGRTGRADQEVAAMSSAAAVGGGRRPTRQQQQQQATRRRRPPHART